jgi:hypothetical protein
MLVGCTPSLDGTAFKCDADHACPSDQSCIFGRCRLVAPVAIGCGSSSCTPDEECCVDDTNPPRCIAATDSCPGTSALCDSIDDCGSGEHCCDADTTACGVDCSVTACKTDVDCPSTEPNCCPQSDLPWGTCMLSC